jgi:subtilisin-like proprotein convertase family protein
MRIILLALFLTVFFHAEPAYSFTENYYSEKFINEGPVPAKPELQRAKKSGIPQSSFMVPCPMTDPAVTASDVCIGNPATIHVLAPESGILYTLRDNLDNSIVDGPKVSTGTDLSFSTGILNSSKTYNVLAESDKYSISIPGGNAGVLLPSNGLMEVTNNFTIEGWIKPNNASGFSRLFNKNNSYALGLSNNQNSLTFTRHDGGDYSVSYSFSTGVWYHIACTFVSGTVEFFVNGISAGTVNVPYTIQANNTVAQIGSDTGGGHHHFEGNIDNVRLWSSVRSESEILDDMHSLLTNTSNPTLVGSWWLIEGTGNALDYSGNGIHGTGLGGSWSVDAPTPVCSMTLSTTPTVNALQNTISLTSGTGSDAQALCNGSSVNITYATTGATSVIVSGLPLDVEYSFTGDEVLISGILNATPGQTYNYQIELTGGCGNIQANGSISVSPDNSITLTSGLPSTNQSVCVNNPIANITYGTTGATGALFEGLPPGVIGSFENNTVTISGVPTMVLFTPYFYTVTLSGGCGESLTQMGSITVNPGNLITLTSSPGTDVQSACTNTAISPIMYTITGATGVMVTGLPAGVNFAFDGEDLIISGIPLELGSFNYEIVLSGGCGSVGGSGQINVDATPNVAVFSSLASVNQTICENGSIIPIVYAISSNTTQLIVTGLPAGINYEVNDSLLTISGTIQELIGSPFNFSVQGTNDCGSVIEFGSISVTPNNTITLSSGPDSDDQNVCINTAMVNITYSTTGATGAIIIGLPDGITGGFSGNTVTISGTPTQPTTGPVIYTINLTGGCGNINASGQINVIPDNTIVLSSAAGTDAQTVCALTPIAAITYNTTGATSAIVSGLPTGINYSFISGSLTIAGSSSIAASNPFQYTITLSGGCGAVEISGSITVNPSNGIYLVSDFETIDQTLCINTPVENIIYSTSGATNATFSGLPDGVTGSFSENTVTISGSPTEGLGSPYEYTVTLTGGCGMVSANGEITVIPDNTISLISDSTTLEQTVCTNVSIEPIEFVTTGATSVTFVDVPIGVEAIWENDTITISGAPGTTMGSPFTIGIVLVGGCGEVGTQVQINTVSSTEVILTSGPGTNIQTVCLNEEINPITFTILGATGAVVEGLPQGVNFSFDDEELIIFGSPSTLTGSPFNYIITLTGDCSMTNGSGSISVSPVPSANPVNDIVVCDGDLVNSVFFTSAFPGAIFSWQNSNTEIGLAGSGNDSISAFIATNAGNEPIEATITIIPESTADFDCNPIASQQFTNSTPLGIPTGPALVSNTITVSGVASYILDVNAQTFLTHTFGADLDITVTSPEGTTVTLTTDNGAGNDNIFNGTLWDDSANPGGQVPYTTNSGMATDHPYVNNLVAETLVPEEAMGAFIGENPNGVWTITISDDLAGDGGSLDSWSIFIQATEEAPQSNSAQFSQDVPTSIPTGPAVVTSTVEVSGVDNYIMDVNLLTNLTHTFGADLDITITSPGGTVVTLTTDNGAGNDNTFNGTLWDDSVNPGGQVPYTTNNGLATDHAYINLTAANPLVPEEALAAFIGEDPNGIWTITISDDLAGDGGSLNSWSLFLETVNCGSVCAGASQSFKITVNPVPVVNQVESITFCNGGATGSISFSSSTSGGVMSYSWTNDNPGIGLASAGNGSIPSFSATNFSNNPISANIRVVPTFTYLGISCVGDTMSFIITIDPILCGWNANPNGINCNSGSEANYNLSNNTWQITSTNCFHAPGSTQDAAAFVQQTLCGDGSITAQVTGLIGNGWAGVMMRENNSAGSKKAALLSSMSTFHRRDFRTVTNGAALSQTFNGTNKNWLRIVRTGNQFSLYISANGVLWQFVAAQNIQMAQCIEIGLTVTNPNSNSEITGTFANVIITGNNPQLRPEYVNSIVPGIMEPVIYPNPADNEVHLDLKMFIGSAVKINLLNIHGQVLLTKNTDRVESGLETLSLRTLPAGLYLVSIKSPGLPEVIQKLVVTH